MEKAGYKLVSVNDRPAKTLRVNIYIVELDGEVLSKHAAALKVGVLGSYDIK